MKLLFTVIAYIFFLCCSHRDSEGLYGTLCIVILVYYKLFVLPGYINCMIHAGVIDVGGVGLPTSQHAKCGWGCMFVIDIRISRAGSSPRINQKATLVPSSPLSFPSLYRTASDGKLGGVLGTRLSEGHTRRPVLCATMRA